MCEHDTHDELAGLDDFDSAPVSKTGNGFSQREQNRYDKVGGTRSVSDTFHEEDCPKCGGTGVWRSYSGYSSGNCFKCKGTGKLRFRTSKIQREKAREQRQARKLQAVEKKNAKAIQWLNDNPERKAWLNQDNDFGFRIAMVEALFKFGSLTPGQINGIDKCIAAQAARAERNRAAEQGTGSGLDLSGLPAGRYAVPGGDTRLKLMIRKPTNGKWEGWVFVSDAAEYGQRQNYGKQAPGGSYRGKVVEQLKTILADPKAAAVAYGRLTGHCCVCGRKLEDEASVAAGIGPICASRF